MKKNIQKNFLQSISRKTFYLVTLFAVVAVAVMGFLLVPSFNNTGTVSAQDRAIVDKATSDALSISLDFKTAARFAVFSDKGIIDAGNSKVKGNVGVAGKDAEIKLDRASVQGDSYNGQDGQFDTLRAQQDLAGSFNAINQLPCTDVADAELGGRKFSPGVYCVSSARLAGQMVLDGENNSDAIFVFRIAGSLNAKNDSGISLTNAAQSSNVFFVAGDSINIGKNSDFRGSILAQNAIKVDTGSTVNGRALSLKGDVSLNGATVVLADGTLEICKVVDATAPGASDLTGRIFQFTVQGLTVEAPANGCSNPFTVTAGAGIVVTEQNTSRLPNSNQLRIGNFQLTDVRQINRQPGAANAVTAFNLPLRTATVTVPMGGVESQVTLQFTNQFSIVAYVEICKQALDGDVAGFFRFTIDGVPQQTSLPAEPLQIFTTPAGSCVGPIAVTVPSTGTGTPRSGVVTVRELAMVGFFFTGATTNPANRLLTVTIVNNTTTAGIVTATVFEANGTSTSNQTTINFFNRSNPGRIKICKVAGPGIAEGTPFSFTVTGTGAVIDPNTGAFSTQAISRDLTVQAGPVTATQNGFCAFVPIVGNPLVAETFVVGTNATITENGPLFNANADEIRVSRITSTSGFVIPAITGNVYFPPNGTVRTVTVPVRREVIEVEYTNFVFQPGQLKVCKVAGAGVAVGTVFTFNVTFDRNQGIFPNAPNTITRTISVAAGSAAQGGICTFVDGAFTPQINGFNTFNVGTQVTVTEVAAAGVTPTSIRTTSGGPIVVNLPGRSGTLPILFGQFNNGIYSPATTEIEFVNTAAIAPVPQPRANTAFDFDGDKKADISVFRDGNWYINRSRDGFTANPFGATRDKLVPADYDGDGKADVAVFRGDANKAYFYILNSSTNQFSEAQFGVGSDIPVPGDYDGDGKSDLAVYRNGANAGDASYIFYRPSSVAGADFRVIQLGAKGDKPVVGDYDGDGKTDAAVFRPSNGTWYVLRSRDGFIGMQFGISTDVPVAADYDGDGKTDIAVYRGGTWYLMRSRDGFTGLQFGAATDLPVPADLDGDGKDDITVFRAGTWYWLNSRDGGFKAMNFGIASDIPIFCSPSEQ